MKPNHPPAPPMTLGKRRELGQTRLQTHERPRLAKPRRG